MVTALFVLPAIAQVREHYDAPLLAVGGDRPAPAAPATTQPTTDASSANSMEAPKAPEAPAPSKPSVIKLPVAPASPVPPVSKLWPRDTIPLFVTSCSKLHRELLNPCRCIIDGLMEKMLHDEFLRLSDANQIDIDPRYLTVREQCVMAAKQKQLQRAH